MLRKQNTLRSFFLRFNQKLSAAIFHKSLTFQVPTPKNGQTHSKNLSGVADDLFECV